MPEPLPVSLRQPALSLTRTVSVYTGWLPVTMAATEPEFETDAEPWDGIEELLFGSLGNAEGFEDNRGNVGMIPGIRMEVLTLSASSGISHCNPCVGQDSISA